MFEKPFVDCLFTDSVYIKAISTFHFNEVQYVYISSLTVFLCYLYTKNHGQVQLCRVRLQSLSLVIVGLLCSFSPTMSSLCPILVCSPLPPVHTSPALAQLDGNWTSTKLTEIEPTTYSIQLHKQFPGLKSRGLK